MYGCTTSLRSGNSILSLPTLTVGPIKLLPSVSSRPNDNEGGDGEEPGEAVPMPSKQGGAVGEGEEEVVEEESNCTVVYLAAAMGVVHDLATDVQQYFEGHSDDVCCFALNSTGENIC